jgi:WD40 repeat protein
MLQGALPGVGGDFKKPTTLTEWDTATGDVASSLEIDTIGALKLAVSPDGTRIAASLSDDYRKALGFGPTDAKVKVWASANGEVVAKSQLSKVQSLCFRPDSKQLAIVSSNMVELLPMQADKPLVAINPKKTGSYIYCLVYSPDGKLLACCCSTGITVHDALTGTEISTLSSGTDFTSGGDINSARVTFSPDGKLLATASNYQGQLKIWDVATGHAVLDLRGNRGAKNGVGFIGPEGRFLVSLGANASPNRTTEHCATVWQITK